MSDEEDVGYRKPPVKTRFRKGQSGNPKGRPKGSRNLATIISSVINKPMTITDRGKRRTIPAIEAVLLGAVSDALKADPRARALVTSLALQADSHPEPEAAITGPKDEEIIRRVAERLRRRTQEDGK